MGGITIIFIFVFYYIQKNITAKDIEKTKFLLQTLIKSEKRSFIDEIFDERIE